MPKIAKGVCHRWQGGLKLFIVLLSECHGGLYGCLELGMLSEDCLGSTEVRLIESCYLKWTLFSHSWALSQWQLTEAVQNRVREWNSSQAIRKIRDLGLEERIVGSLLFIVVDVQSENASVMRGDIQLPKYWENDVSASANMPLRVQVTRKVNRFSQYICINCQIGDNVKILKKILFPLTLTI